MYISKIQLNNFKRFTDLTLDLSAIEPPKLVLLIGANGSGKTSVFDAFEYITRPYRKQALRFQSEKDNDFDENAYFAKQSNQEIVLTVEFSSGEIVTYADQHSTSKQMPTAFYGRSAFRQVPVLLNQRGGYVDVETDFDRPKKYIDRDLRFQNDIDSFPRKILEDVFSGDQFDNELLKDRYIEPLNRAFQRIFGDDPATALTVERLIPSLNELAPDIRFRKGNSTIHYDLLSSGEKEVFNILLNLFNRREHYTDTIYFIDELDVHLNTSLQHAFLQEIVPSQQVAVVPVE